MTNAFAEEGHDGEKITDTYTQLVGYFVTARLFNGVYFLIQACLVPMVRGFMVSSAMNTLLPSALWIASISVPMPQRLSLIVVAIVLGLCLSEMSFISIYSQDSRSYE